MQESPRAIIHFLGGDTLAVPPGQIDNLLSAIGAERMTQLQVGSRVTWINPKQVTYIQMPSVATQSSGDGAHSAAHVRVY